MVFVGWLLFWSCVLVLEAYTEKELETRCQQNLFHNHTGHPVDLLWSLGGESGLSPLFWKLLIVARWPHFSVSACADSGFTLAPASHLTSKYYEHCEHKERTNMTECRARGASERIEVDARSKRAVWSDAFSHFLVLPSYDFRQMSLVGCNAKWRNIKQIAVLLYLRGLWFNLISI